MAARPRSIGCGDHDFEESGQSSDPASTHGLCRLFCRRAAAAARGRGGFADVPDARARLRVGPLRHTGLRPALAQQTESSRRCRPTARRSRSIRPSASWRRRSSRPSRTPGRWRSPSSTAAATWSCFTRSTTRSFPRSPSPRARRARRLQFKRPSKDLDDAIARGGAGNRLLALKDITPIEGGMPIVSSTAGSSARSASPAPCRRRMPRSPRPAPTRWRDSRQVTRSACAEVMLLFLQR